MSKKLTLGNKYICGISLKGHGQILKQSKGFGVNQIISQRNLKKRRKKKKKKKKMLEETKIKTIK